MKKLLLLLTLSFFSFSAFSQIEISETVNYKGVSSMMYAEGSTMFFNFSDSIIYLKVKYYFSEEAKNEGEVSKKTYTFKAESKLIDEIVALLKANIICDLNVKDETKVKIKTK